VRYWTNNFKVKLYFFFNQPEIIVSLLQMRRLWSELFQSSATAKEDQTTVVLLTSKCKMALESVCNQHLDCVNLVAVIPRLTDEQLQRLVELERAALARNDLPRNISSGE